LAFALGLGFAPVAAQAPTDVREALVIGNNAYANAPLANPVRDAAAMAQSLREQGFRVTVLTDASRAQMAAALAALGQRLTGRAGVGWVYFAGHGVQVDDTSLLLPVDARVSNEADLRAQGLPLDEVVATLRQAGARFGVLVLDACRDNPFKPRDALAGLAPRDPPPGMLIGYATEPGNVAQDGVEGGNGLYTRHLLDELRRGGSSLDDVFKRVRYGVWRVSRATQIPSYVNGAEEAFSMQTGFALPVADRAQRAAAFERERAHWDRIKASRDTAEFFTFIDAYPHSALSELAQAQLERLARRSLLAQGRRGEAAQNPADDRFRVGDSYRMELRRPGQPPLAFTIDVQEVREDVARYTNVFGNGVGGESTVAGAVVADGISTFDPPYVLVPGGEYQVGKRWSGRSLRRLNATGRTEWMDYSGWVRGRETIDVPAGRLETYRVEIEWQYESGPKTRTIYWVQPQWGIGVRTDFDFVSPQTGQVIPMSRVLVARQRRP
jgi:uncharacterized caspase-like protein